MNPPLERPLMELENITFHWKDGKGFDNVSLRLAPGDFVLLSGPSGEGKSTLLRLLVRLEEPQSGRILLEGKPITELPPPLLRRRIAMVRQLPIMGGFTVRDALLLPYTMSANADLTPPDDTTMRRHMETFLLEGVLLETEAASLSPGQQQRISVLRTLLLQPDILLLDEPTSALDAESRGTVEQAIETANLGGTTVLFITHTDYMPARTRQGLRRLVLHGGAFIEAASVAEPTTGQTTAAQTTGSATPASPAATQGADHVA